MKPNLGPALMRGVAVLFSCANVVWSAAGAPTPARAAVAAQTLPEPGTSAPPTPLPNGGSPQPQPAGSFLPIPPPAAPGESVPAPPDLPPGSAASPGTIIPPASTGGAPGFPNAPHRGVPPPSPAPSPTAAGRFHLHRPGTDVDGDVLSGSMASQVYVLKGNVTLHSDPKIDREIAAASESDDPLTVTADEIDADHFGLSYVAKGHVHFVQGTRSGFSDLAMLDERNHSLDLIGNVEVLDGNRRTKAAKMHYDTVDKGFIGSGNVRIYEPLPTPNPNVSSTPPPKRKLRLPL